MAASTVRRPSVSGGPRPRRWAFSMPRARASETSTAAVCAPLRELAAAGFLWRSAFAEALPRKRNYAICGPPAGEQRDHPAPTGPISVSGCPAIRLERNAGSRRSQRAISAARAALAEPAPDRPRRRRWPARSWSPRRSRHRADPCRDRSAAPDRRSVPRAARRGPVSRKASVKPAVGRPRATSAAKLGPDKTPIGRARAGLGHHVGEGIARFAFDALGA